MIVSSVVVVVVVMVVVPMMVVVVVVVLVVVVVVVVLVVVVVVMVAVPSYESDGEGDEQQAGRSDRHRRAVHLGWASAKRWQTQNLHGASLVGAIWESGRPCRGRPLVCRLHFAAFATYRLNVSSGAATYVQAARTVHAGPVQY